MANVTINTSAAARDSGEKQRWVDNNNNSNNVHTQKHQNKPRIPDYFQTQTNSNSTSTGGDHTSHRLNTVASDDSSSHNHLQPVPQNLTDGSSIPGYVRLDSKVIISLGSRSNLEIRQLKRKLVSELDQVRTFKRKLEAKESECNGFSENRVATLARVNSEMSYVGPTNSRRIQGLTAISVDNDKGDGNVVRKNLGVEKRTSKSNQTCRGSDFAMGKGFVKAESKKKLKAGGDRRDGGGGGYLMGFSKDLVKKCGDLLGKLMKHRYGWVFNTPVDVKKLKLHDYYKIIKHPMDLGTVKSRLTKNLYKSPTEFAEDVRLTFKNAMTYNEKGQDVHTMADVLLKIFEENWGNIGGHDATITKQTSKRTQIPAATPIHTPNPTPVRVASTAAQVPQQKPLETRTSDRSESLVMPMEVKHIASNQGNKPVSKKPHIKDAEKRDMTYEEKQKLSTNLQSLPSEKLDTVVQIIRNRNPGLFQQEDEIEVDIDSFDAHTLWELHQFVTNYKSCLNRSKRNDKVALQGREEPGHNIQDTNMTFTTGELPKDPVEDEKIAATSSPIQGKKQHDNVSGSNASSSSHSDSRSSSSDSDSDSCLRYGTDAGQ